MANGTDILGEPLDALDEPASTQKNDYLRRAHEWGLILGTALGLAVFLAALLLPGVWVSSFRSRGLADGWFIAYVCSLGLLCLAGVCGIIQLFHRQPEEDTPNLRALATYSLTVLALAFLSIYLPDFRPRLSNIFWHADDGFLRVGIILGIPFFFVLLPLLFHILFRAKRSSGLFDAWLMVVLAIFTVDLLCLYARGYTRESLFSLYLMGMLEGAPLVIFLFIVAPWLFGGWLLNTRRSRVAYFASTVAIFSTCTLLYGFLVHLWLELVG